MGRRRRTDVGEGGDASGERRDGRNARVFSNRDHIHESDGVEVASDDGAFPDVDAIVQVDFPDEGGGWRDVGELADLGEQVVQVQQLPVLRVLLDSRRRLHVLAH